MTHNKIDGKYFASKYEAIGYLKEDVFPNPKRTARVFKFIKDYFKKADSAFWDYSDDSQSDELQPQEDEDENSNANSANNTNIVENIPQTSSIDQIKKLQEMETDLRLKKQVLEAQKKQEIDSINTESKETRLKYEAELADMQKTIANLKA